MGISTGASGGYTVPTELASILVDFAGNSSKALDAGVRVVPMDQARVTVPKIVAGPAGQWYGEHDDIDEEAIQLAAGVLEARRLSTVVKVSIELMQDSALAIGNVIATEIGASFARSIDKAVVAGTGGSGEPLGIRNWPDVPAVGAVGNLNYDDLVLSASAVRQANREPNSQIMFERDMAALAQLKSTTGDYLRAPSYLDGVARFATTNLDYENTTESYVVTGDYSYCLLGVRLDTTMLRLDQTFATNGEVGFVFHWRGDVLVSDPNAFDIRHGVTV